MFSLHPTFTIYLNSFPKTFLTKNSLSSSRSASYSLLFPLVILISTLFIFSLFSPVNCININSDNINSDKSTSLQLYSFKSNGLRRKTSRQLQHPKIRASYVVNNTVKFNIRQVANQVNVTLVLPKEHYQLSSGEDFIIRKVLRLHCSANYPVEWIYQEGSGAPFHITSRSVRQVANFSDPSTYIFSSTLDIFKNDDRNAGRYSCKSISLPVLSAFYDVFTPNDQLFLSTANKTVQISENDSQIIIPCAISDPRVPVTLYKLGNPPSHRRGRAVYFPVNSAVKFEPLHGFYINVADHPNFQGTYVCKDTIDTTSGYFSVLPPKNSYVKATPETSFVKIVPGQKQTFKCESNENVTLTFSGDRQPRIINTERNDSSNYLFETTYELNPTEMTEHTIINCVTNKDNTVLHTWEYSTYDDVSISKFYFDGKTRFQDARYVCCSNSFYKPKLEYIFCRSETECHMKKLILYGESSEKEDILSEYSDRIYEINSTCVGYSPYFKFTLSGGILRCSVNGITNSYAKDYLYYFNPYRIFQAYTDSSLDTSKVKFSEAIMKLSKTPSKNIIVGQKSRFLCYYSEFFFSNGIQWAMEMKNGSIVYISNPYEENYNTSFSQLEMKFEDTDVKSIHCYAPVRVSSTEWRNLSGPMYVKEPPQVRVLLKESSGKLVKVLNDKPNTHTVLDKSELFAFYYQTAGVSLWRSRALFKGIKIFFVSLECNGSYPLDWVYEGNGAPDIDVQTYRLTDSIRNISTYRYSAVLTLVTLDEKAVGKYSCVSVQREFGHKGTAVEDLNAAFYLFIPGKKLFLAEGNQTLRLYSYRDSVLIPCTVSDSRVKIFLEKFDNTTEKWDVLEYDSQYDASHGFSLNKTLLPNLHGLYRCSDERQQFHSGVYNIVLPKDIIVKPTPLVKEIKISKNESQTFKCEGKENVTLAFSEDTTLRGELVYETDFDSLYPYIVSYKTEPLEFLNFTVINCTTVKEPKVTHHTWEYYPTDSNLIDYFYFDNSTNVMTCCTKPYREAYFEWMPCSSVSECVNRQSACLYKNICPEDNIQSDTGVSVDYTFKQAGCIGFNITKKTEGFLRCSVKGILKIVSQAVIYYFNPEKKYQIHDSVFSVQKVFDKYSTSNDKIMQMYQDPVTNITLGEKVKFTCVGSKFFLSSELKWALERSNGSVEYIPGKDIPSRTRIYGHTEVQFNDTDWRSIYCIGPSWNDYYSWRNISIPLHFVDSNFNTNI